MKKYALAYYKYIDIKDPYREVMVHKKFFKNRDAKGRIYISSEGINGQISASKKVADSYINWLEERKTFPKIDFKIHECSQHTFHKMTVKYRKQLVALNREVNMQNTGKHVSPKEWRRMLESDEYIILDVRNNYEWEIGHFEKAEKPDCRYFRDFPEYIKQFKKKHSPDTSKIMMCCTGGIRCEPFSALLKEEGYDKVFQLEGGMLKYGLEEGTKHWKGKLFVFDDRLSIPIDNNSELNPISKCYNCSSPSDNYYNCKYVICDRLFLCCEACHQKWQKCCSKECYQKTQGCDKI